MAALGTTDITTTLVGNAISSSSHSVSALCAHANVNKWSRYKPTRGATGNTTYYKGTDDKFGFNFAGSNPNKWNYLQPNTNYRLGDFRGYNHAVALDDVESGPVVYCDYKDFTDGTDFQPSTSEYNIVKRTGVFRFGKNTAHNSIRILDSDLGINGYYWGVMFGSPSSAGYYKTIGNISNNSTITFDLLFTNPSSLSFTNGFGFPADAEIGTWTWQLFITDTNTTSWTATPLPTNSIYLPTDGTVTIYSSGTFDMKAYIVCGYTSGSYVVVEQLPKAGGTAQFLSGAGSLAGTEGEDWDYVDVETNSDDVYVCTRYESDEETAATWYNFVHSNDAHTSSVCSLNTNCSSAIGGLSTRVYCNANTGADRMGRLRFTSGGGEYWLDIYQQGPPPTIASWEFEGSISGTTGTVNNWYTPGDTTPQLVFTPNYTGTVWCRLYCTTHGYLASWTQTTVTSGVQKTLNLGGTFYSNDCHNGGSYSVYVTTVDPNA